MFTNHVIFGCLRSGVHNVLFITVYVTTSCATTHNRYLYVCSWQEILTLKHYCDVRMSPTASQITSLTIIYSTIYSGRDQRKHQSSVSLAFVWGIHCTSVNSLHKWPVTRKMFPFDAAIMIYGWIYFWDSVMIHKTTIKQSTTKPHPHAMGYTVSLIMNCSGSNGVSTVVLSYPYDEFYYWVHLIWSYHISLKSPNPLKTQDWHFDNFVVNASCHHDNL